MRLRSEQHSLINKYLKDGYASLIHATFEEKFQNSHSEFLNLKRKTSRQCLVATVSEIVKRVKVFFELEKRTNLTS